MKKQHRLREPPHLPANAGILVIGEVVTDPAVNLAEGHLLGGRGVDGIGDEGGVAVPRFAVLVDGRLIFAQGGIRVCGRARRALAAAAWRPSLRGTPKLLDGSSEGQLRQPVYGGEAALKVRSHGTSGFCAEENKGRRKTQQRSVTSSY